MAAARERITQSRPKYRVYCCKMFRHWRRQARFSPRFSSLVQPQVLLSAGPASKETVVASQQGERLNMIRCLQLVNMIINCTLSLVQTMEGYLLKQSSFQRWRRRYFRIVGNRLSYSKEPTVSSAQYTLIITGQTRVRRYLPLTGEGVQVPVPGQFM